MTYLMCDVDGTVFWKYKNEDRKFIERMYLKNPRCRNKWLINLIDHFSRWVDKQSVISNTKRNNEFRLWFFDVIGRIKSHEDTLKEFGKFYVEFENRQIEDVLKDLDELQQIKDVKVMLVTNNPFFNPIIGFYGMYSCDDKEKIYEYIIKYIDPMDRVFFVGDNLNDDIFPVMRLKKKYKNMSLNAVYIGTSFFVKMFKNMYVYENWRIFMKRLKLII